MTQGKFGRTACKEPYIVLRYVIICHCLSLLVFILHLGLDERRLDHFSLDQRQLSLKR